MMDQFFITVGMIMFGIMTLLIIRAWRGPTAIDRILAVNTIGTKTMLLLVVIGTIYHRVEMFVDLAITYALLNFLGSLAAARFFRRRGTLNSPFEAEVELRRAKNAERFRKEVIDGD